jgi:iron(III) transport system substrate-binding protein
VQGQEVIRDGTSFEYPVGSGVPANSALVPLDELQAPAVNPSPLDGAAVTELMTQAGLL